MSLIMGQIETEHPELFALELEKLLNMTLFILSSANINQSVPDLATVYLPIRSQMRLIMEQIKPEHLELFALGFGKIAETDFVYTLASPNINQSAPNLVKMYVKGQKLFALEFAKLAESGFVYTLAPTNVDNECQTWSQYI